MENIKSKWMTRYALIMMAVAFSFYSDIQAEIQTADPIPRFEDYPAKEVFTGKNAPIKLSRETRFFRTRLRKASKRNPDFAGRYILATWGCGNQCRMGAVIDPKTGKIYPIPFTICCWGDDYGLDFKAIEYRIDSKLIIFTGARDEKVGDEGKHFYIFDGKKFVHLLSKIGDLPKGGIPEDTDE